MARIPVLRTLLVSACVFLPTMHSGPSAAADRTCNLTGHSDRTKFSVARKCPGDAKEDVFGAPREIRMEIKWVVACYANTPSNAAAAECSSAVDGCPGGQLYYRKYQRVLSAKDPTPAWRAAGSECRATPPPGAVVSVRELASMEFRRARPVIAPPDIQPPGGQTLVNLDTIYSTSTRIHDIPVTLLGNRVTIRVIPIQFSWHFGDGDVAKTSFPGRPYPHKDIVHKYREANRVFHVKVEVTYRGEFSTNAGSFEAIEGTINRISPTVELRVREARAELIEPGR